MYGRSVKGELGACGPQQSARGAPPKEPVYAFKSDSKAVLLVNSPGSR